LSLAGGLLLDEALPAIVPPYTASGPHARHVDKRGRRHPEELIEKRRSLIVRMHQAGVRPVGGADAGIGHNKGHGLYAEAVIELAAVTGIVGSLAASTATSAQV
jgi:hypothetical protein